MNPERPNQPNHIRNSKLIADRLAVLETEYGIRYTGILRLCTHPDYQPTYQTARDVREVSYRAWKAVTQEQGATAGYQSEAYALYKQAEANLLKTVASLAEHEFGVKITSTEHLQYLRNAMQDCAQIQRSGMSPN